MRTMSLLEFAAELSAVERNLGLTDRDIVDAGCQLIKYEARGAIGSYKYGWPQLAASTQAERARKGYAPNDPLLRTGQLRASIEYTAISDHEGEVGSDLDIAVFQELGTSKMPPRPFLEPAAKAMGPHIAKMAGRATAATIAGQSIAEIRELLHLLHATYETAKEAVEPLFEDQNEERRR